MKKWKIPVSWIDRGTVEVEANTLAEAINSLYERYQCIRPNAKDVCYGDGTFDVDDTEECIRENYNNNQPDDQPLPYGFPYNGQWITDPTLDPTGRFPLSKAEAAKLYGFASIAAYEDYISKRPGVPTRYRPEVTEICPDCESEITLIWDPEKDGYQVYCPKCGKKLMLCTMCPEQYKCDWKCSYDGKEHCSMMEKYHKITITETRYATVFVKADTPEEAERKASEVCGGMDLKYDEMPLEYTCDRDYKGYPYTDEGTVIIK